MQEFKVGDMVTVGYECKHIPSRIPYVICEDEDKMWYINYLDRTCIDPNHWQLISPKQRTIEEVRVGDITVEVDNKNPAEVVEVLKNTFAYIWNDSVQWITFKRAKELDWKIKQPEENKETTLDDVQSTLERIEKIEKEKSDILSKLSEITKMCL